MLHSHAEMLHSHAEMLHDYVETLYDCVKPLYDRVKTSHDRVKYYTIMFPHTQSVHGCMCMDCVNFLNFIT